MSPASPPPPAHASSGSIDGGEEETPGVEDPDFEPDMPAPTTPGPVASPGTTAPASASPFPPMTPPGGGPATLEDWYADGGGSDEEPPLEFMPPEDADIFSIGDPADLPDDDETPAALEQASRPRRVALRTFLRAAFLVAPPAADQHI